MNQGDDDKKDRPGDAEPINMMAFLAEYRSVLVSVLSRCGIEKQDQEDILQRTYSGALTSAERFDPSRSFVMWVKGIAIRQALKEVRRIKRWSDVVTAEDEDFDQIPDSAPSSEQRVMVHELLAKLNAELQPIFVAREIEGMTFPEIAESFGITEAKAIRLNDKAWEVIKAVVQDRRAKGLPVAPIVLPANDTPLRRIWDRLLSGSFGFTLGLAAALLLVSAPNMARTPRTTVETRTLLASIEPASTPQAHTVPTVIATVTFDSPVPMMVHGNSSLADERRLIEQANGAFKVADYDKARWLLGEHAKRFPRGQHAGDRDMLLRDLQAIETH